MRSRWLCLVPLIAACDNPAEPPVVPPAPQCEAGFTTLSFPTATSTVVSSTATYEDIRLTCHQNASVGPVEYRYRVSISDPTGSIVDVPQTNWTGGDMPTIRVTRHPQHDKVLIWDVRVGEATSTGLRVIHP
jgi:hypothetical protein